jgi:hypothetical protein
MTVYLLWAASLDAYKVGYTAGPVTKRVRAIQGSCPVPIVVLGDRPGTRSDEAAFHRQWRTNRGIGEWFSFSDVGELFRVLESFGILQGREVIGEGAAEAIAQTVFRPMLERRALAAAGG